MKNQEIHDKVELCLSAMVELAWQSEAFIRQLTDLTEIKPDMSLTIAILNFKLRLDEFHDSTGCPRPEGHL